MEFITNQIEQQLAETQKRKTELQKHYMEIQKQLEAIGKDEIALIQAKQILTSQIQGANDIPSSSATQPEEGRQEWENKNDEEHLSTQQLYKRRKQPHNRCTNKEKEAMIKQAIHQLGQKQEQIAATKRKLEIYQKEEAELQKFIQTLTLEEKATTSSTLFKSSYEEAPRSQQASTLQPDIKPKVKHCCYDVCNCEDCLEEAYRAMHIDEDQPKKSKKNSKSQQRLKERYEANDPEVGLLGEPSGKFDYYVIYKKAPATEAPATEEQPNIEEMTKE